MGMLNILESQARPDQMHTGFGVDPVRLNRFANPDLDASLGQGCKKTDSPLWPGRPYLGRGNLRIQIPIPQLSDTS